MPQTGTEEYYRRRVCEYDRKYDKPERQQDLTRLRRQVAALSVGRRVLEVAAGTGWWTDVLADAATQVTASDVNAATLEVAVGRRSWPPTVRFVEGDAFALDTLTGDFDTAFAGFFWSHIPLERLDAFLDGLVRRLERSALLVFLDNRYVLGSSTALTRRDAHGNTYQRRRLDDGSDWEVLKNFPTPEEVSTRLGRVASEVEIDELNYYWIATCRSRL